MKMLSRRPFAALSVTLVGGLAIAGGALADNIQNDVVAGGNDTIEAGASTTVNYRVAANNGDGQTGCNAADATPLTVTPVTPSGVTATPSSVQITGCGDANAKPIVFSSALVGNYDINVMGTDAGVGSYNTNPARFTLKVTPATAPVDTTAPVITPSVVGTLGSNGWYTSDVALSWGVSDPESAVTSTSGCDAVSITADQANTDYTCSATSAGGTSSQTVSIKRDATAPVVAVTGVTDGAEYVLGSVPAAGCSTSDATSGVATEATPSVVGGTVGESTATCSGATDNAGNAAAAVSATYRVIFDFVGFFRPIDNGGVLNVVKAGSAIPVKFSLGGDQGLGIFAAGSPSSRVISCSTGAGSDDVEETVTAGQSTLQYDPITQQYTYVWKTDKAWAGSCRELAVTFIDGKTYTAKFQLKK